MNIESVIKKAEKGNTVAQRYLYDKYKMSLFSICLRYGRDQSEAKDILQEGFIKIFRDLHQFNSGNIEGWMRKIMVHTALNYLRKWKRDWQHEDSRNYEEILSSNASIFHKLDLESLTSLIQKLPDGYRAVFNLYVIEGYSHKEISTLLGMSESTSKSQLFKAKAVLRKKLEQQLLT